MRKEMVTIVRTSKALRVLSTMTLICFMGNSVFYGAPSAWADGLIPGSDQTNQPQGSAKTPDAVLGSSNQWDTTTVNNSSATVPQNTTTYYSSGKIKSKTDVKTGAVTEYADDSLNRTTKVTYTDGTQDRITGYVNNTDKIGAVSRYNPDGAKIMDITYTYAKTADGQEVTNAAVAMLETNWYSTKYTMSYIVKTDGSIQLRAFSYGDLSNSGQANGATTLGINGEAARLGNEVLGGYDLAYSGSGGLYLLSYEIADNGSTKEAISMGYGGSYRSTLASGAGVWNAASGTLTVRDNSDPSNPRDLAVQLSGGSSALLPYTIKSITTRRDPVTKPPFNPAFFTSSTFPYTTSPWSYTYMRNGTLTFNSQGLVTSSSCDFATINSNPKLDAQYTNNRKIEYTLYTQESNKRLLVSKSLYARTEGGKTGVFSLEYAYAWYGGTPQIVSAVWDNRTALDSQKAGSKMKMTVTSSFTVINGQPYQTSYKCVQEYADPSSYLKSNSQESTSTLSVINGNIVLTKGSTSNKYVYQNGSSSSTEAITESAWSTLFNLSQPPVGMAVNPLTMTRTVVENRDKNGFLVSGSSTLSRSQTIYGNRRYDASNAPYQPELWGFLAQDMNLTEAYTETTDFQSLQKSSRTTLTGTLRLPNSEGKVVVKFATSLSKSVDYGSYMNLSLADFKSELDEYIKSGGKVILGFDDAAKAGNKNEVDPKTGKVTQTTYANGDIKQFDSNGLVTSFYESKTKTTTDYHSGTTKIKTVTTSEGTIKSYDPAGVLTRQDEKTGNYTLFAPSGKKTFTFEAQTGNKTDYDPSTGVITKTVYGDGRVALYNAQGLAYRLEFMNGNYQLVDTLGKTTFLYDAKTGSKTEYDGVTYLVKTVTLSDGTLQKYTQGILSRVEYVDGSWKEVDATGKTTRSMDKDGFDQDGFGRDGFHKTTDLDKEGYAKDGYHSVTGLNRSGLDKGGYNAQGLDREGYARDGFNLNHTNRQGDTRVLYADGSLKSYFNNGSKVLSDYNQGQTNPYKESYADGSYRLLGVSNNIVKAYSASSNVTEEFDEVDIKDRAGRLIKSDRQNEGIVETYSYSGNTRTVSEKVVRNTQGTLLSKTINGNEYTYWSDGSTVKTLRRADGSYEERTQAGRLVGERFATPDSFGALGYDYDDKIQAATGKGRKTKTVYSDGSYIITTYKDDATAYQDNPNTESFFDKDNKHLRTLTYNSKGTQVRWMVTEDNRKLDCFFDECWKEDMGFDTSWNSSFSGSKVAVIEAGAASGEHAMAVAGILKRISGTNSDVSVFTAPDQNKVMEMIRQAATAGYKVINLSLEFIRGDIINWGAALGFDPERAIREFKASLQDAVDFARNLGATIVASAGNQGSDFSVLAELEGVVSVGATDLLNRRASWTDSISGQAQSSGFGQALDFMATGYQVWSGVGTKLWTGTSFAAPMISGMMAGLSAMQNAGNFFSQNQMFAAMQSSAKDLGSSGWDKYFGYGKANAGRAIRNMMSGVYQMFVG